MGNYCIDFTLKRFCWPVDKCYSITGVMVFLYYVAVVIVSHKSLGDGFFWDGEVNYEMKYSASLDFCL